MYTGKKTQSGTLAQVAQCVRCEKNRRLEYSHEEHLLPAHAQSDRIPSGIFSSCQGRVDATLGCCCCGGGGMLCRHLYRPPAPSPCHLARLLVAPIIGTNSPGYYCHISWQRYGEYIRKKQKADDDSAFPGACVAVNPLYLQHIQYVVKKQRETNYGDSWVSTSTNYYYEDVKADVLGSAIVSASLDGQFQRRKTTSDQMLTTVLCSEFHVKTQIRRQQRHSFKCSPTTTTTTCCRPLRSCSFSEHGAARSLWPSATGRAGISWSSEPPGAPVGGENRRKQVSL